MGFWPSDIFLADNQSPREIMESAGAELSSVTNLLTVKIRETRLPDRIVLAFIVENDRHSLEFNVFEASHQPSRTYPVAIDPPTYDIPDFLKRERRIRGSPGISALRAASILMGETPDTIVENEWVCATPQEFREKLKKVLSLDFVKSNIVSLLAPSAVAVSSGDQPNRDKSQEMSSGDESDGDELQDLEEENETGEE